jgi:hypothetical protein
MAERPGSAVRRRRILEGGALLAFGLSGLILVAVGLAAVAASGPDPGEPGGTTAVELRVALDGSEAAVRDAAAAARSTRTGLLDAAHAAGSAGALMTDLAATIDGLAALLEVPILGTLPFGAIAPGFASVADRAAALAADLEQVRDSVGAGADDVGAMADRLADLAARTARLRGAVDAVATDAQASIDGIRILATGFLAWLALPAAASTWVGLRRLGGGRAP